MNTMQDRTMLAAAERLARTAGRWDARLRSPRCTDEDRRSFAAWRDADPSHQAAFERLQAIIAGLRLERSRADLRAIRDSALGTVRKRRVRRNSGMAAAVAGMVLAATWLLFAGGGPGGQVYSTGAGQRSTVELQDGSVLELSSATRVEVAFSEARRSVTLRAGQAIFKVARQHARPFVVHAGDREIVALGTMFDVRLERSALRVTLLEGKVTVNRDGTDDARGASDAQSDAVVLQPGQQAVVTQPSQSDAILPSSAEAHVHVRAIDVVKVTAWLDGRVFLEDMPLTDAVTEMNRHSATQILITDPQLSKLRVNGMFIAGEQHAFAAALAEYFPIAMERRGEREILLRPRR